MKISHFAIAVLLLAPPTFAAATKVTLAANTSPGTGQAAVGYVSVAGTGFPSGTINASAVTLTLTPVSGTVVTTKAAQVKVISGSEESIAFQIPATVSVATPTAYAVSAKGQTTTGVTFVSKNTAALTIDPAASLLSVSPSAAHAALSLTVTITGAYTAFVQGTTAATFGAGITVGSVTVTSPTTATVQISIDATAVTGAQTVTVTTGSATESLAGGVTVESAVAVANIDTTTSMTLPAGFSGFQDEYDLNGVEYWDPKYIPFVQALKPGWIRFPGGSPTMAFDWQAGHMNQTWINDLQSERVDAAEIATLSRGLQLLQAKGGAALSDFATFRNAVGSPGGVVDFNGWTDTNANSAELMVQAAQAAGVPVLEWELCNEPYFYPGVFATGNAYAKAMSTPYYTPIRATDPNATVGLFFEGEYNGLPGDYRAWDNSMQAYSPQYWQGVSMHFYPVTRTTISTQDEEKLLNGVLAHGTNEYFASYVAPLIGANTPLFITEFDSDGFGTMPFEGYIYNAIFQAEFVARVSTVPNLKATLASQLYLGNDFDQSMIRAVDDSESYLISQVTLNPSYSTNTAVNPNTQFQFYYAAKGLAFQILNTAVNSSNATWLTTFTGGPTVPIQGFDGSPVPAVFAQAFAGTDGTHYVIITNKSNVSVPIGVEVNGLLGPASVAASYISSSSDTAMNTATDQNAVQIVNTTFSNPMTVGPYSVTRIQW